MRIHGVGVEQVILHAADHAPEGRDVTAQHAVVVHAAQLVGDAARRAQDFEEQPVIARVLAKLLVDQPQAPSDGAYGAGAHTAQLRVLFQQRKQFEQRGGLAREQILADRFERTVPHLKLRRQRLGRRIVAEDRLAEQLQQQLVEQLHIHDGAVVALHQLLDRQGVGAVLIAEAVREPDLVIEQQAVLMPAGQHVQPEAHFPQEGLRLLQAQELRGREEAVRGQFIEGFGAKMALGYPGDGLDVAQAPRARLDVGFEVVGRVVGLQVPLLLLAHLGGEVIAHRPDAVGGQRCAHLRQQRTRAGQPARFQERGHHPDIRDAFLGTLADGPHAVADLQSDVPEEGEEAAHLAALAFPERLRGQHHDVDIRAGVELGAPIAAHRGERQAFGQIGAQARLPQARQQDIDEGGAGVHQRLDRFVIAEALLQFLLSLVEQLAAVHR